MERGEAASNGHRNREQAGRARGKQLQACFWIRMTPNCSHIHCAVTVKMREQ
jgi:hypothetical protein